MDDDCAQIDQYPAALGLLVQPPQDDPALGPALGNFAHRVSNSFQLAIAIAISDHKIIGHDRQAGNVHQDYVLALLVLDGFDQPTDDLPDTMQALVGEFLTAQKVDTLIADH